MIPRFEVFKGEEPVEQSWYWHLRGGNGEIQCQSESYGSERDARRGVWDARWSALKAWLQPIKTLS